MTAISAQRNAIARLIFGAADADLSIGADGLNVTGSRGARLVAAASMTAPLQTESGLLWARLIVTTASGREVLRGFARSDLQPLASAMNVDVQRHAQTHLLAAFGPLTATRTQIDELLGSHTYIKDSERKRLLEAAAAALAVRSDSLWAFFATPAQRQTAEYLGRFVADSQRLVASANEEAVATELDRHRDLFDSIESKPLTVAQRRACVVCEDHNLVLAGAGTGKTSTMIGRAGYLLAAGKASPEQILMLAFATKAAGEMQERQDARLGAWCATGTPTVKTFHALGLDIIRQVEGRSPSVSPLAEDEFRLAQFVNTEIDELGNEPDYRATLIRYCTTEQFPYRSHFDFASMKDYEEYVRTYELRTLAGELVKSFEEVAIANFLNSQGVGYEYERPYPIDTADETHRGYSPDFYLPDYDVYIEHFALDQQGRAPAYFERGYEEGVAWKRSLHSTHNTELIETYSWMKREGTLESGLAAKLLFAGVEFSPRDEVQLLAELRESSQVKDVADLLAKFLGLFKQANRTLPSLRGEVDAHEDRSRLHVLLDLFEPVLSAYTVELSEKGYVDFADMIRRATSYVEAGRFVSPFAHVLVDEFQDISAVRAQLVAALLRQREGCVLFAVGDDWQSIYRFTGSDIGYTRDFARVFGPTATTSLDTTFRFNSSIGEVASRFVLANPLQIRKEIHSLFELSEPAISLVGARSRVDALRAILDAIDERASAAPEAGTQVLILARYNFTLDDWPTAERHRLKKEHPALVLNFMTVHGSKGKEADYVVVLGLEKGRNGFPAKKPVDAFFEILLPRAETFPYAEERRLFYVALTRARHRVYVMYDPMHASPFVGELQDGAAYAVRTDEFANNPACMEIPHVPCPKCASGSLVPRTSEYGVFTACDNYPSCDYRQQPCPKCGGIMRPGSGASVCANPKCGAVVRLCPRCGGSLVERKGRWGAFLGCSNYSSADCKYKEKVDGSGTGR